MQHMQHTCDRNRQKLVASRHYPSLLFFQCWSQGEVTQQEDWPAPGAWQFQFEPCECQPLSASFHMWVPFVDAAMWSLPEVPHQLPAWWRLVVYIYSLSLFTSLRDGNRPHRIVGQPLVTANDVGHWDQKHPKVLIVGKKNAKNLIAMYSGPTQFKK